MGYREQHPCLSEEEKSMKRLVLHSPPRRAHYLRSTGIASVLILVALAIGVSGYHFLNREPWIDALLDATMILGGMGPVSPMINDGAKLFASFYALFSGLVFIAT